MAKKNTVGRLNCSSMAAWWRASDRRYWCVVFTAPFFGITSDTLAVTDDFGNLVKVAGRDHA